MTKVLINDIEEQYCSFEIAKLLKEKNFKVPSKLHYPESKHQDIYCRITDWNTFTDMSGSSYYFTKPTHSVAIEWIRVNYGIWITVTSISQESWQCHMTKKGECLGEVYLEDFDTPQEAIEAALKYVLENLID